MKRVRMLLRVSSNQQLEADGLKFQEIPPEVSFDFV